MKFEQNLRSLIRDIILESAKEDFMRDVEDVDLRSAVPSIEQGKEIKRIWRRHRDASFFVSLKKVHWVKTSKDVAFFLDPANSKTEVSVMLYKKENHSRPEDFHAMIGIQLEGVITLAANNMNCLYTGYHASNSSSGISNKNSGFARRPMGDLRGDAGKACLGSYMLDADSFRGSGQGNNEGVIDNWRPVKIIIIPFKLTEASRVHLLKILSNTQLPVVDEDGDPFDLSTAVGNEQDKIDLNALRNL